MRIDDMEIDYCKKADGTLDVDLFKRARAKMLDDLEKRRTEARLGREQREWTQTYLSNLRQNVFRSPGCLDALREPILQAVRDRDLELEAGCSDFPANCAMNAEHRGPFLHPTEQDNLPSGPVGMLPQLLILGPHTTIAGDDGIVFRPGQLAVDCARIQPKGDFIRVMRRFSPIQEPPGVEMLPVFVLRGSIPGSTTRVEDVKVPVCNMHCRHRIDYRPWDRDHEQKSIATRGSDGEIRIVPKTYTP